MKMQKLFYQSEKLLVIGDEYGEGQIQMFKYAKAVKTEDCN